MLLSLGQLACCAAWLTGRQSPTSYFGEDKPAQVLQPAAEKSLSAAWKIGVAPAQGAVDAALSCMALRMLLQRFVNPEPGSIRQAGVNLLAFGGSAYIGFVIAESLGAGDTQTLNLIASVAGSAFGMYQLYRETPKPEQKGLWDAVKGVWS